MKITRKWQDLVLDGNEIDDLEELESALRNDITADLLEDLFKLYKEGSLQLWLRSHDGESAADELDELTLSGDIVKNLYDICYCICTDVEEEDIAEAVVGDLVLDGEEISDLEELADHPSTELLERYKDGTLQLWLRYHDGESEAGKLDKLVLSGDDAKDLYAICKAVGILITLKDIEEALEEAPMEELRRIKGKFDEVLEATGVGSATKAAMGEFLNPVSFLGFGRSKK